MSRSRHEKQTVIHEDTIMDHDNDDESGDDDMNNWGENDDDWGNGEVEIEDDDEDDNNDDDDEETISIEDKVTDKFILTFTNGNYDTEFDNELSTDRGIIVSARPMQVSYNKPDDWRERNRIGLERVKEQLQNCITSATDDQSFNLHLIHNTNRDQLMDNEEPIVWHESVLDEYWDQLEAQIDWRKQQELVTEIEGIHISNVEMKKECLAALVAIFNSGRSAISSTVFIFNNANICGKGIVCLSKLVDVSSNLQEFCLQHNRIDNIESARCLSRSLKSHIGINHFDLFHCDLGSNPEILLVILQSDVKGINLSNNNIDSLGAAMIAEYIGSNPPIEYLFLCHNLLNDDDTQLISQALKRNTHLDTLSLHTNNFTSIGVKALLTCVFDASSLNAISESNHTLNELTLFWYSGKKGKLDYCIDRLLELDCKQKIMLALQDKDSLLQYLANVPVEIMPEVLTFPLRQVDNYLLHKHLNIVYSTMRWWNMPLLYSYRNCVKSDTKRKRVA
jgi:hypothetical protein